jgi:L-ascorbate metabolism protein UlaG (beta-lactamase superfamily)
MSGTQVLGKSQFKISLIAVMAIFASYGYTAPVANEHATSRAHYLGNAGVMVEHGATKILFDPLFRQAFDEFELVPPDIERALLAGEPPWDGIDAVFVSHYHEDHYDPVLMLSYLRAHPAIELYAPAQAVDGLREVRASADDGVFDRVHSLAIAYGDAPVRIEMDGLLIEAVHIPHTGWPERWTDVENISFRVTLDDVTTVTHLGDADADVAHFEKNAERSSRCRHTGTSAPRKGATVLFPAFTPITRLACTCGRRYRMNRLSARSSCRARTFLLARERRATFRCSIRSLNSWRHASAMNRARGASTMGHLNRNSVVS